MARNNLKIWARCRVCGDTLVAFGSGNSPSKCYKAICRHANALKPQALLKVDFTMKLSSLQLATATEKPTFSPEPNDHEQLMGQRLKLHVYERIFIGYKSFCSACLPGYPETFLRNQDIAIPRNTGSLGRENSP